jgi:hypothetical protein
MEELHVSLLSENYIKGSLIFCVRKVENYKHRSAKQVPTQRDPLSRWKSEGEAVVAKLDFAIVEKKFYGDSQQRKLPN